MPDINKADVYAVKGGKRTFYARAVTTRELFQFTDEIEELGLEWDFDLV